MSKYTYAIILAAGNGTRFHGQKQFLEFHGKNCGNICMIPSHL